MGRPDSSNSRMIRLRVSAAIVALALTGAAYTHAAAQASPQANAPAAVVTVSAERLRSLPTWNLGTPILTIGNDGDDERYSFNRAGLPVLLSDGRIAIPNEQREIRYFDKAGKYLMTAGRAGRGPGDFQQLWSIYALPGDSLLAYDAYGPPNRMSTFGPDGRYARSYTSRVDATEFAMLPDRSVAAVQRDDAQLRAFIRSGGTGVYVGSQLVARVYPSGRVDSISYIRNSATVVLDHDRWMGLRLAAGAYIGAGVGGIVSAYGGRFELRWFDSNGAPARVVRAEIEPTAVTDAVKSRVLKIEAATAARRRQVAREGPAVPQHWASTLPVIARVRMDRTGRVWVRRWTFDDEPTAEWIVFSVNGQPIARVTLPGTFTFHDAGADYLLGRYTDDDGVQSVRMYRLPK
jgi:hypothetical protein